MKYALFFVFLLLVTPQSFAEKIRQENSYDFSAVDASLKLFEILRKDTEPAQEDWDQLFEHDAYRLVLSTSGLTKPQLINRFSRAFMPSRSSEFDSLPDGEKFEVLHLRNATSDLSWLKSYKAFLLENRALEKSLTMAKSLLPKTEGEAPQPTFVFGLFGQNAFASARGVVIDAYLGYLSDKAAPYTLAAHELHHYLYDSLFSASPLDRDNGYERVLYHIQKEGIPNLLDKDYFLGDQSPFSDALKTLFQQSMDNADANLALLDKLIVNSLESGEETDFSKLQQALPLWGHSVGWYITATIDQAEMRSALLETVNNPFKLFAVYNRAAEKLDSGQATFSKATLDLYKKLSD